MVDEKGECSGVGFLRSGGKVLMGLGFWEEWLMFGWSGRRYLGLRKDSRFAGRTLGISIARDS
jgi:hypothetical protein